MTLRGRLLFGAFALCSAVAIIVVTYVLFVVADAMPAPGAFRNVSPSMAPTLLVGDRFTIRSIDGASMVAHGQLVAHQFPPDPTKEFVKRVVGVPGDTLAMVRGVLYVNAQRADEPYAWREDTTSDPVVDDFHWQRAYLIGPTARDTAAYAGSRNTWGPISLPPGMFFVLGDNRDNSLDSRYWGFLPAAGIRGLVRRVYFSEDSAGHIRWSRLGRRPL